MTRSGYRAIACVATIAVLVVVGCASGAAGFVTDGSAQAALQRLVTHNEALAVAAYCALVIAGCAVLAVPGAVYAVAAAALFGPLMGTVWCSLAATVGAVLAFLAGRFFLRDAVRPRVLRHDLLRRWLFSGSRRNEVATLAVTRLVPLFPFNVQNFAYARETDSTTDAADEVPIDGLLAECSGKTAAPADEQAGTTEAQTSQEAAAQEESAQTEPAAKKTMVIGDTTFNSENWEETVDPHRTYNGWACIRYGIGETLVHYTDSMELEPWLAK